MLTLAGIPRAGRLSCTRTSVFGKAWRDDRAARALPSLTPAIPKTPVFDICASVAVGHYIALSTNKCIALCSVVLAIIKHIAALIATDI